MSELESAVHPWKLKLLEGDRLLPFLQDDEMKPSHELPPLWIRNGSVYVSRLSVIDGGRLVSDDVRGYPMPPERSLDIDTERDLEFARSCLRKGPRLGSHPSWTSLDARWPGRPTLIVAEIGNNHDGSLGQARALIRAAAEAGADAVKFQTHIADAEMLPSTPTPPHFDEPRYEFTKRMELSKDDHLTLKAAAEELGLLFFSSRSPWTLSTSSRRSMPRRTRSRPAR